MASGRKNYFRHSFFARNDEIILDLIDKFGYKGYFFWFALLEICGEQASDEYPEKFKFHQSRLYRELRCNRRSLKPVLEYLQTSLKLVYNYSNNFYEIDILNFSKYLGKYQTKLSPNTPNKRKEKKRKEKKIKERKKDLFLEDEALDNAELNKKPAKLNSPSSPKRKKGNFDFNTVYKNYPRREGKKAGFKKLEAEIKNENDYKNFCQAVKNYSKLVEINKTEKKYIKLFSTFVNNYEDYIDYEFGEFELTEVEREAKKKELDKKLLAILKGEKIENR